MEKRYQKREQQSSEPVPVAGRVPPHDLDAEAAVLSAVLLERDALDKVLEILKPNYFYSDSNRRIFEAVVALAIEGDPVDITTVGGWLRSRGTLEQSGGAAYLIQIIDATPSVHNIEAHARIVAEKWRLRQLIGQCQRIAAEGYSDVGTIGEFIESAEESIHHIAQTGTQSSFEPLGQVLKSVFEALHAAAERGDRLTGLSTGFGRLDDKTAGLQDGDLTIVAARPGMGKTAFVLNLAVNVASPRVVRRNGTEQQDPGDGVCIFSLEMPREQLAMRMACGEGRVDLGKVKVGQLQAESWRCLTDAAVYLNQLPIFIDDTAGIGVMELRAKARRKQAEYNRPAKPGQREPRIGLVIVDYLQLMKGREGAQNREQEISEISRGLKELAKELRVPVIALSQLNRAVEGRTDKRPQLSDLRESGAIEQDADMVMFIYRDDYYNENSNKKGIAELIIAKQRNGPTGKVLVRFASSYTRFDNLAPGEYDSDGD